LRKHGLSRRNDVHAWLRGVADRLSARSGVARGELELTEAEIESLLDIASVAAHESGARTNAPLTCYLLGLARGRSGAVLPELIASASPDASGEADGA
jgi:hypothetical protein